MSLQNFQQLSFETQIALREEAVCIGKRETLLHTIFLYRLEDFYVELLWRKPQHLIDQVNSFDDPERLSTYQDLAEQQ